MELTQGLLVWEPPLSAQAQWGHPSHGLVVWWFWPLIDFKQQSANVTASKNLNARVRNSTAIPGCNGEIPKGSMGTAAWLNCSTDTDWHFHGSLWDQESTSFRFRQTVTQSLTYFPAWTTRYCESKQSRTLWPTETFKVLTEAELITITAGQQRLCVCGCVCNSGASCIPEPSNNWATTDSPGQRAGQQGKAAVPKENEKGS